MMRTRDNSFLDLFFSGARMKRLNLKSDPISILVHPLPTQSRPEGFSGLVGHFDLHAQLGKQKLAVGDSSTLTIVLSGDGNLRDFSFPEIKSPDFKVYEDQPAFNLSPGVKHWKGTKTFKKALVPLKGGNLQIPSIQLSYFDPIERSYKTLKAGNMSVQTAGSPNDEAVNHVTPGVESTSKKKIEILGKDLMPIKRDPFALKSDRLTFDEQVFFIALILMAPLAYGCVFLLKRKRDHLLTNKGLLRKRRAFKGFKSLLKDLKMDGGFFDEASLCLREYLGDKFNLDGKAITPMDAERKLGPFHLSQEAIKRIESFLKDCETVQFGGVAISQEGKSKLKVELASIVDSIEREAR
jgi:hypothetical protein